ncbi:hypothetical protein [Chitinophaga sp. Ak27]|uniref:hypothetical protein n=1 Tax=Chitinophaga sp. Ak27 TaxID=2726116 RepID=UPI00145C5392|nr:hypothetical protein [Chitinophaga sp. Ak27]NLU96125.1 hypothetical protein [Chitinophaga sp. Ak27]
MMLCMLLYRRWLDDAARYWECFSLPVKISMVTCVLALICAVAIYGWMMHRWRRQRRYIFCEATDDWLVNQVIWPAVVYGIVPEKQLAHAPLSEYQYPEYKQLFIRQLMAYRKSFTGNIPAILRTVYLRLELQAGATAGLYSRRSARVQASLKELSGMGVWIDGRFILRLTKSKNEHTRWLARSYMVQCAPAYPLEFLEEPGEVLLPWQQFELSRMLIAREDIPVPLFEKWIDPRYHPTIISFALRLATHYQQRTAVKVILRLLPVSVETLRIHIIGCLGQLHVAEVGPLLKGMYEMESSACRTAILQAIDQINAGAQPGHHGITILR